MKLEKGKRYKTRGGWEAECIWVDESYSYFMHFNPTGCVDDTFRIAGDKVCGPIYHFKCGASANFSVNEPPTYYGHPADIISLVKDEE